jgi:pyruvate/2-oxoglutarate dehydrogenase complex dihydrolipoamide acyltransferase (E2) component
MSADRQPLLLPQYGMGMTEATVVEWRKQVGDRVAEGEVVVLLEASKAEVEMESPVTGTLAEIVVEPDETVPVQSVLAYIDVD